MIQTYPNYFDQTQVIGFGIPIGWHGVHTEISYIINQYDITVDNSIPELTINNDIISLPIDNNIQELSVR